MKIFDILPRRPQLFLFLLFFLPLLLSGGVAHIRILQTTDIHGQYSDGKDAVSAARLGTLVTRLRKQSGEKNTLYIDCGDLLQGTFTSSRMGKGSHFAQLLDLWKCDAFIPGNHDFDFGVPAFIKAFSSFQGKILACNLSMDKKALPILPWAVFERGGIRIGVIGLAPRFMDQWFHPRQLEGVTFHTKWKDVKDSFASLMRQEPHFLILAMHQGEYHSERKEPNRRKKDRFLTRLFREYPQILLVLGGHTHQTASGKRIHRGQWYVQAPPLAKGIAVIDIKWDKEKRSLLSLQSRILSSAEEKPHPPSAKHLFPAAGKISREGKKVICNIPAPLQPLRGKETSNLLTRIFCKSMLEATGADIAFHGTLSNYIFNGGPLREQQLFLLAPYENSLVTIPLTPEELQLVMNEQKENIKKGYYQSVYGIKLSARRAYSRPKRGKFAQRGGAKRESIYLVSPSGKKTLWEEGEKNVAFTAYVLSGAGGRFPYLRKLGERKAKKLQYHTLTIREAFREYLLKNPVTERPEENSSNSSKKKRSRSRRGRR